MGKMYNPWEKEMAFKIWKNMFNQTYNEKFILKLYWDISHLSDWWKLWVEQYFLLAGLRASGTSHIAGGSAN